MSRCSQVGESKQGSRPGGGLPYFKSLLRLNQRFYLHNTNFVNNVKFTFYLKILRFCNLETF